MLPRMPRAWLVAAALVYFLYFFGLTATGLVGPDEPRYASVAREMARSGDWITPRLWGAPWFEKPALLYWMTGAGFRLGLGNELAPRLPVALMGAAFLAFYFLLLRREWGGRVAFYSTAVLGTSAGWIGYSFAAVTDVPMAALFSAAMLLALRWVAKADRAALVPAAFLLGLAVLAKGLVPVVLALPLVWFGRRRLRDLLRPAPAAAFALAAVPWYLLCYLHNGWDFIRTFFLEHQFGRFASEALQHKQPFWFYLPVLAAALLPWTPALALVLRRGLYRDPRCRFLLAWVVFGFVFFSAATNKLPGYLIPLLPAAAALIGLALAEETRARGVLAVCAATLVAIPVTARILPAALAGGLSWSDWPAVQWTWVLPALAAAGVGWLEARGRRDFAAGLLCAAVTAGIVWLKLTALPVLDQTASARSLWREIAARREPVCVTAIHRNWRYGLNYYSVMPLPDCEDQPAPWQVVQPPGKTPELRPSIQAAGLDPRSSNVVRSRFKLSVP